VAKDQERGALVLVLADDEEIRDGIEALLETDGYRISTARNIEDAAHSATRKTPDLILVTLAQPPYSIVESAAQVRTLAGLSERVPIIIFCCPTIRQGAELRVEKNIYLTRPDNFDQLRRLLSRLLSGTVTQQ
jgi:DNA-binding response OmpR family regulator